MHSNRHMLNKGDPGRASSDGKSSNMS
jgi:hypothetical protein